MPKQSKALVKEEGFSLARYLDYNDELSDLEKMFIKYYIGEAKMNPRRAAQLCGIPTHHGSDYKANPKIADVISRFINSELLDKEEALLILARQARGSLAHFRDEDGNLDVNNPNAVEHWDTLSQIEITEIPTKDGSTITKTKIKLHDPRSAIELLGKHDGWFEQDQNVNVNVSVNTRAFEQLSEDDLRAARAKIVEEARDSQRALPNSCFTGSGMGDVPEGPGILD